ncbi:MAG: reverse transcriptase domain-containing protein [Parabacteroides sp.]
MINTDDMLEAYYDCRKNKRRTASAVVYEMNYESNLLALRDRINARTYTPGKSICFVVTRPRFREVFAASFEDRIVHHFIAIRLEPLFEAVFNPRTFNCRKGKGQLYGINMLRKDLEDCSNGYTTDCYILKLDLKSFFMSIDKSLMARLIDEFIVKYYKGGDIEDLRYLSQIVVLHHPENNCEKHSPAKFWSQLPANKSLFTNGENRGIAIGNLFSQLFANFLLNILDWYLEELGIKYHGRYVDDFYCIHSDKQKLLDIIPLVRDKLASLGLSLNEKKFYLQHYKKGVEFTGSVVKPGRVYCCQRILTNFIATVLRMNNAKTLREVKYSVSSINSYLGLLRHCDEYAKRREILEMLDKRLYEYIYFKGHFEAVVLRKRFRSREVTLKHIRDGDY